MNVNILNMYLSMAVFQMPVVFACLVAVILILTKCKPLSQGAVWALLGFGITLALCVLMPAVNAATQMWMMQNPAQDVTSRVWVLQVSGAVSAIVHALSYVFFLIAVLAGRSKPAAAVPQQSLLS